MKAKDIVIGGDYAIVYYQRRGEQPFCVRGRVEAIERVGGAGPIAAHDLKAEP